MSTGPAVSSGFDLCLTEMPDAFPGRGWHRAGGEVISAAPWRPCSTREVIDAQQVPRRAEQQMEQRRHSTRRAARGRFLETNRPPRAAAGQSGARALGEGRASDAWPAATARWSAPPASAATVDEVDRPRCDHVRARMQSWDSCFTAEHSYMNSGTVREIDGVPLPPVADPQAGDLDRPVRLHPAASAAAGASPGARSAST